LVVVARFGGGSTKPWCDLGVRFLSKGDEGVEVEGRVRKPLPPPDGGI